MRFPQDLVRFLYMIYFKPISLQAQIDQLDPTMANMPTLLTRSHDRSFKNLVLFYILIAPLMLAFGTGMLLSRLGMDVNWLRLAFYLFIATALSLTFSVSFSITFLLPFSLAIAIWNSFSFNLPVGILFSLSLGVAYGLSNNSPRWGLTAGFFYGVLTGLMLGPLGGLAIGAAFLTGYFRIVFYLIEAPLSWSLGTLAVTGDALRLWQFQPVLWDELIWFRLPMLDGHLKAIRKQNGPSARAAIFQVRDSFRQGWAAEQVEWQE